MSKSKGNSTPIQDQVDLKGALIAAIFEDNSNFGLKDEVEMLLIKESHVDLKSNSWTKLFQRKL